MTANTTSAPRRSAARTRALILAALAEAAAPITVIELAEAAGVGKSTLGKHLPALEKDGLATRTPGGREGRRRLPDTWQATPSPDTSPSEENSSQEDDHTQEPSDDTAAPALDTRAEHTWKASPEVSASQASHTFPSVGLEQVSVKETTEAESAESDSSPVSPELPTPPGSAHGTSTITGTRVETTGAQESNPVSGSTRLAPGELKLMVKAILDASPGEEFTATAISHLLAGRSIGAIQNNLARLAKEERAVQTCDRPRRYRSVKYCA